MSTIPVSTIISVAPGVLSAGGNPLALNGLILSESAVLPFSLPVSFASADAVASYFGSTSLEAKMATVYFNGFNGSTQKPNALLFSRYAAAAIPAFLRGGKLGLTLAQLKAIPVGSLSVTVDGHACTNTSISFGPVSSFTEAAEEIASEAIGTYANVTYDSQFDAFVITSKTTGATSTLTFGTGTIAAALKLTAATGAVTSQGSAAQTPGGAMASLVNYTTNWAGFTTAFEPVLSDKEAFSTWTSGTGGAFFYVPYDTDITATQNPSAFTGLGAFLVANSISGVAPVYGDPLLAAFALGVAASIDYTRVGGRVSWAFKSGTGLNASVTDTTSAANLLANGYNYYGAYATAAQKFNIFYNGQISGLYRWIDSYVNAIWLNSALQLSIMTLFTSVNTVPYTPPGYALIKAACMTVITEAVQAGVISPGVPLSALQIAEVNAAAGLPIDKTLSTVGWYLQVLPATSQARGNRTSPPCTLWYMDGGSVNRLNLASIDVQ